MIYNLRTVYCLYNLGVLYVARPEGSPMIITTRYAASVIHSYNIITDMNMNNHTQQQTHSVGYITSYRHIEHYDRILKHNPH